MKANRHAFVFVIVAAMLLAQLPAYAQQPLTLEPSVKRLHDNLALNDEQTTQVREVLTKHMQEITELQQRAQKMPYSQKLQIDIQKLDTTLKEEIAAFLTDEQKAKLPRTNAGLPIPMPPPFIVVPIPPRTRSGETITTEPLLPAVAASSRTRTARLTEDQKILHLLNRVTFGARPGDIERVRRVGLDKFLSEQLHPETIDDSELETRLAALPTLKMNSAELWQFYPPAPVVDQRANEKNPPPVFGRPGQVQVELVQQKLIRAVSSNRQLQEIMTDFWFNHFNVFVNKDADQWMLTSYERDVIRPNAMGKFKDLLLAVAQSPAMLFYLDNWLSQMPDSRPPRLPAPPRPPNTNPPPKPPAQADAKTADSKPPETKPADNKTAENKPAENKPPQNPQPPAAKPPAQGRKVGINENYARELMELHTLGVDGGYTQKDVQEVARCFTGWTIDKPYQSGPFMFRPWMHDTGSKTILGVTIPAGGGISDGLQVIDLLAHHPSAARFISQKLCQRFVSDTPSPQLVERVAQVFLKTDGDIRKTLRAILTSPEFNSVTTFRSKMKSPLELVASAIRAVDGDTNGAPALNDWMRRMGEPLYQQQAPTGYKEDSTQWNNTGVFLNRINFMLALANNQINGTTYDAARLVSAPMMADTDAAMSKLTALITHTELSTESRHAVRAALEEKTAPPTRAENQARPVSTNTKPEVVNASLQNKPEAAMTKRLAQLIGVLLGTAEFQRK